MRRVRGERERERGGDAVRPSDVGHGQPKRIITLIVWGTCLHWFALVCTGLHWFALVCTGLHTLFKLRATGACNTVIIVRPALIVILRYPTIIH